MKIFKYCIKHNGEIISRHKNLVAAQKALRYIAKIGQIEAI